MYVIIDIYDSARWLEMAEDDILVLRLLCCMDGIPAFTCNGITLMPMEFMLLNFPPWLRFKVDNMFISMLMPHDLPPKSQKKYFDKIIENDFNPMAREGLRDGDGRRVVVKIFGQVDFVILYYCTSLIYVLTPQHSQTLDLKGKEKFLDQVSVNSYMGCSHCRVHFPKGCRGPRFGVARRYLPAGHPLRRQVSVPYEYHAEENEGTTLCVVSPLTSYHLHPSTY